MLSGPFKDFVKHCFPGLCCSQVFQDSFRFTPFQEITNSFHLVTDSNSWPLVVVLFLFFSSFFLSQNIPFLAHSSRAVPPHAGVVSLKYLVHFVLLKKNLRNILFRVNFSLLPNVFFRNFLKYELLSNTFPKMS